MATSEKYVLFPIQNDSLWQFYKKALSSFWTVDEIDLSRDRRDWQKLNIDEQNFLGHVLAFFAASDGMVGENLVENFCQEVQFKEAKCFYGFQVAMENIHAEMYSLLIEELIKDTDEREKLFTALESMDAVKQKAAWILQWMDKGRPFGERLVAFAVVEGLFFAGSFAAIFWVKQKGILHGLSQSNELISRDEGMHTDFACALLKFVERPNTVIIEEIVRSAVEVECMFFDIALPKRLKGMNSKMMQDYILFVANSLLVKMGSVPIYQVANPFPFMQNMGLETKSNFFERKVSEYKKVTADSDVMF